MIDYYMDILDNGWLGYEIDGIRYLWIERYWGLEQ